MNIRNYTQVSFKNFPKKTLIINKLIKPTLIPNLEQKTNTLFLDPDSYLKFPNETNFQFVVGRKPKGPRFNSDKQLIPYSIVGAFMGKEPKKVVRKKSMVSKTTPIVSSKSVRKSLRLSKMMKFSPVTINELPKKEDKKKKRTYRENLTYTEIFNIFNSSKKRINKNKIDNLVSEKTLYKEIPKVMHKYINEPLSQQERSLKSNEKYNNILKKIENNISKTLNNKNKGRKYYNDSKSYENNIYNSSDLMKYSGTEYRTIVEKKNFYEKKKNPILTLNNHVQNWEMSLRRPKNFIGKRREYLNIRTDTNPYWIVLTEKNPLEDEKIINTYLNNNINKGIYLKNFYNTSYFKTFVKPLDMTNNRNNSNDIDFLQIKGKKLIDIEEKMALQMKGNIKMIDMKYDKDSIKDMNFKTNYSINKHSFSK